MCTSSIRCPFPVGRYRRTRFLQHWQLRVFRLLSVNLLPTTLLGLLLHSVSTVPTVILPFPFATPTTARALSKREKLTKQSHFLLTGCPSLSLTTSIHGNLFRSLRRTVRAHFRHNHRACSSRNSCERGPSSVFTSHHFALGLRFIRHRWPGISDARRSSIRDFRTEFCHISCPGWSVVWCFLWIATGSSTSAR